MSDEPETWIERVKKLQEVKTRVEPIEETHTIKVNVGSATLEHEREVIAEAIQGFSEQLKENNGNAAILTAFSALDMAVTKLLERTDRMVELQMSTLTKLNAYLDKYGGR